MCVLCVALPSVVLLSTLLFVLVVGAALPAAFGLAAAKAGALRGACPWGDHLAAP